MYTTGSRVLTSMAAIGLCIGVAAPAQSPEPEPVLLIRMPGEPPIPSLPDKEAIASFLARRGESLQISQQDLLQDPQLARRLLGQSGIFEEAAQFQKTHGWPVKIKFIDWTDAFRFYSDYASDPNNPPLAAQLGDTWAPYFKSLGVLPYVQRFGWDVRMLWYWKDMVDPTEISDGPGFMEVCRRIRAQGPAELEAPFVIPTALNWNLLHDLSIWLYNAGLPTLVSTDNMLGILPWNEAVFANAEGIRGARFLIGLAKEGLAALPDRSSEQVGEDFLSRRYAMTILGFWVADRAHRKLGPDWMAKIGTTLPPRVGAAEATTMKGGSLLVVFDPTRGQDPAGVERAKLVVDFLTGEESQRRYADLQGDLPSHPTALAELPLHPVFQEALRRGRSYPPIPEWAPIVENLTTRDNLYAFWKRLAALSETSSSEPRAERAVRERLILAALSSAQADINRELSPGKVALLWPWLLALLLVPPAAAAFPLWRRRVEKKRDAAMLMASEEKYRDLYDNAPDMFCTVDRESGEIVQCNRMLATATGYSKQELIGKHLSEIYHPDSLKEAAEAIALFYQSGEVAEVELQLRRKDGSSLEVSQNMSAVRDEDGRVIRTRTVWRDIERRKRSERESQRLREQLAHLTRAATVGELTASLAHEVNQPLTAIVSNAQAAERMLAGAPPQPEELAEVLKDIACEGKRASEVVRRLRALLVRGDVERTALEINEVVEEVVQLVRGETLLQGVSLKLELTGGLPPVSGDRVQLQQVVLNLILNAAESMHRANGPGEELAVKTSRLDEAHVEVAVRDEGAGISEQDQSRIFEAFFTTKPNGLGMGLSINKSIVEAHGGRLWATPNPQRGATFRFTLPVERQAAKKTT